MGNASLCNLLECDIERRYKAFYVQLNISFSFSFLFFPFFKPFKVSENKTIVIIKLGLTLTHLSVAIVLNIR